MIFLAPFLALEQNNECTWRGDIVCKKDDKM
jgi:hypothetical protein